jgi:hypothetical protein
MKRNREKNEINRENKNCRKQEIGDVKKEKGTAGRK